MYLLPIFLAAAVDHHGSNENFKHSKHDQGLAALLCFPGGPFRFPTFWHQSGWATTLWAGAWLGSGDPSAAFLLHPLLLQDRIFLRKGRATFLSVSTSENFFILFLCTNGFPWACKSQLITSRSLQLKISD